MPALTDQANEVALLGAGSWGTALALVLARGGHRVRLWSHDPAQVAQMQALGGNERYLPGVVLPASLQATADLAQALGGADAVLIAVPSHAFRQTLGAVAESGASEVERSGLAWATKGIEPDSLALLDDVVRQVLPRVSRRALVSGPSFAREVAIDLPTAVVAVSEDLAFAGHWAQLLSQGNFRVYTGTDMVGSQLGGAVKNVLALAAGISDGLGFGANARAALITRGLAELRALGEAMGARAETFMGLAGVGDLVLTCTDDQSRNRRAGLALAQGQQRQQIVAAMGQVIEGFVTAASVHGLARREGVEMPICDAVYDVLENGAAPLDKVRELLARDLRSESA